MTPKERAAMQQALEALEEAYENGFLTGIAGLKTIDTITVMREALDHSGEADGMVVGWDRVKPEAIASDPLYQQGFVDGVEEGRNQVAEQAEQEPVACKHEWFRTGAMEIGESRCIHCGKWNYAAPVRTKDPCHPWQDLTDDEIMKINVDTAGIVPTCDRQFHFARAVIAADREKNK